MVKKKIEMTSDKLYHEEIERKQRIENEQQSIFTLPPMPNDDDDDESSIQEDRDFILRAYSKKYSRKPNIDEQGHVIFSFDNEKEAQNFFESMASKNKKFLALEVDSNGHYTGNYHVSLGDGKLISGNMNPNEINRLISQYKNLVEEKNPEKKIEARRVLDAIINKQKLPDTQTQEPEESNHEDTVPNPFSTTLKI